MCGSKIDIERKANEFGTNLEPGNGARVRIIVVFISHIIHNNTIYTAVSCACVCVSGNVYLSLFWRKTTDVCALAPNADYVAKPAVGRSVEEEGDLAPRGRVLAETNWLRESTYQRVRVWVE